MHVYTEICMGGDHAVIPTEKFKISLLRLTRHTFDFKSTYI